MAFIKCQYTNDYLLTGYLKAAPAMKKGKNYLKPENQLLKLKSRNFKKLSPS